MDIVVSFVYYLMGMPMHIVELLIVPTGTPDADWDAGAYFVDPSGDFYYDYYYVMYSYGQENLRTRNGTMSHG